MKFHFITFSPDRVRRQHVTSIHLAHICEEIGSCWKEVGALLRVPTPAIKNINLDESSSYDKAWEVLQKWKQQEGGNATVGNLVDALVKIGKTSIAQKLLGKALNRVSDYPKRQAYI